MSELKFYRCWCGYQMPEQNVRAIASHQEEHPTEEQRVEREQRKALSRAVEATDGGLPLGFLERRAALLAMLTATPEVLADEVFFKPLRKAVDK